jgi:hypothetical protein
MSPWFLAVTDTDHPARRSISADLVQPNRFGVSIPILRDSFQLRFDRGAGEGLAEWLGEVRPSRQLPRIGRQQFTCARRPEWLVTGMLQLSQKGWIIRLSIDVSAHVAVGAVAGSISAGTTCISAGQTWFSPNFPAARQIRAKCQ